GPRPGGGRPIAAARRGHRGRRDVPERGGKKGSCTPTRPTRRGGGRTRPRGTARGRPTGRRGPGGTGGRPAGGGSGGAGGAGGAGGGGRRSWSMPRWCPPPGRGRWSTPTRGSGTGRCRGAAGGT